MITTITLNPCIDQRIDIPSFERGGMNRVTGVRRDVAGKGINVSIALRNLGADSLCLGFNFAENGAMLTRFLDEAGIPYDFVYADGAIRTNIKLCEADTRVMTEINQSGAYVPPEAVKALQEKVAALDSTADDILILSGSRPQGIDAGIYTKLAALWRGKVIIDADGEALSKSVAAPRKPFLIKPNLYELESAFDIKLTSTKAIVDFCRGLALPLVCVSLGGDGALLISDSQAFYAEALDIPIRGLPGAGDAMVAGLAYGMTVNAPPDEMLRLAAAAAAASVIREGTQMCTRDGFEKMLGKVRVSTL